MINQQPSNSLSIRLSAIILGISILCWLTIEEKSEILTILLATIISAWLVAALLLRYKYRSTFPIIKFILAGILVGAIITPLILFLMVFKTGLHAHLIPDYSNEQIHSVINRTPIWVISGFFIGIGLEIIVNSLQIRQEYDRAIES